jgi:hypothetical protein
MGATKRLKCIAIIEGYWWKYMTMKEEGAKTAK